MGALFAIVVVVMIVLYFGGQAAATSQLKRDNKESMRIANENWARRQREIARQTDTYYDAASKSRNDWFYGDGSLKKDPYTGKTYPKGQYRAMSNGMDCHLKQAGPDVKRPPKN